MTRTDILTLPPDQLPRALQDQGLLPDDVSARFASTPGELWVCRPDGYRLWQPHVQIAHAWPLVDRWGLTIAPSQVYVHGWCVSFHGTCDALAQTFADVPAAICRTVLLFNAQRTAFEQGGAET